MQLHTARLSSAREGEIIHVVREHEAGMQVADVCRKRCISPGTFYQWEAEFRGLEMSRADQKHVGSRPGAG